MARRPPKTRTPRGIVPKTVGSVLTVLRGPGASGKAEAPAPRKVILAGGRGEQRRLVASGVAEALGKGMFTIDLPGVVSKYIGETEKNLRALFDMVEASGAVLYFDEADALFGKRTAVKGSHDRYANIDVAYLRKRLVRFRGLLILAANTAEDIDPAFLHGVDGVVSLPPPRNPKKS
jgi:SpoVK/Ycf46/Vps4 family AAA+-type ATPase